MDAPSLRISAEEFGRFLSAYNRGIFPGRNLGNAFLYYYGLLKMGDIYYATDSYAQELIIRRFVGRLD